MALLCTRGTTSFGSVARNAKSRCSPASPSRVPVQGRQMPAIANPPVRAGLPTMAVTTHYLPTNQMTNNNPPTIAAKTLALGELSVTARTAVFTENL